VPNSNRNIEPKKLYIAWTGTDGRGLLNIASSDDGLTFADQVIFNETSPFAPCVSVGFDSSEGFHIILACVGTDPKRTLNAIALYPGEGNQWGNKGTFWGQMSLDTPAVIGFLVSSFMLFTGTDTHLVFGHLSVPPTLGNPITLDNLHGYTNDQIGGPDFSGTGPALAYTSFIGGRTQLAYIGLAPRGERHLYTFTIGGNDEPPLPTLFGDLLRQELSDTSFNSPAIAFNTQGQLYWAWTGTDGRLNFADDQDMPRIVPPL
jgi:hypothetical protein